MVNLIVRLVRTLVALLLIEVSIAASHTSVWFAARRRWSVSHRLFGLARFTLNTAKRIEV